MQTENLELTTADGPMRLHVAHPANAPTAGVIVLMEAFGLNNHIEGLVDRLAAEGFLAVAPDLYHRYEKKVAGYKEMDEIIEMMSKMSDSQILSDVDAAIKYLANHEIAADKVGVTGFCMGGRVAFLTAISRVVGAAVTFYGAGIATKGYFPGMGKLADSHNDLSCPWLGLFGDLDTMIPIDALEEMRLQLQNNTQTTEIVRYGDADHGFCCEERPFYNAEAAVDAWKRMVGWFNTYLYKS